MARRHARASHVAALAGLLLVACVAAAVPSAGAAPTTPMVNLGTASTYAVLSGASVGNTVSAAGAPHTTLRGNLGVKVSTQPTGFPPGIVIGTTDVGNAAAIAAHADLVSAYDEIAGRTGGDTLAGALAGTTVGPGLHNINGAVSNTTTVTLDAGGDPNAVFVFQVNGAMAMAAGSHVVLTGGARAARVFWQVNGAGAIGANAGFAGTLMALDAVAVGAGSTVNGRAFARNGALTLDANEFYSAPPVVTIGGGAAAITTDTTPTISGLTDIVAPAFVTVTINGQTLTATPSGGAWSVTSAILPNAAYTVVASVVDGAGNPGVASQLLTVDTVPPVVTLDGGGFATTNDPTPTIAGTSDLAAGAIVQVAIGPQVLTALVQASGTWNITPSALIDGSRLVTASVADLAGNPGTASQLLTIDTTAPAVTIAGGASALTRDATPDIHGTADVATGTSVTVTLADETLAVAVASNGTWSAVPAALSDGPHRIVMTVSDTAGNQASLTQILVVDTVAPLIAITGGAVATTTALAPTITGTSDAAAGTVVTVSIGEVSMTALLQANGTWNATPPGLTAGTWAITASIADPAGNLGSAGQSLTIGAGVPPVSGGGSIEGRVPALTPDLPLSPFAAPPTVGAGSIAVALTATVAGDGSQRVRGSSLWIGTRVTAPVNGRVVVTASGTVRTGRVGKAIRLTTVRTAIAAGRSATLKLRPKGAPEAARAALVAIKAAAAAGRGVTARITVTIVDAAGGTRKVERTVRLT